MMEAAPEGLIEVKSSPRSRRGHDDALDWNLIVPWLREHPWIEYATPPVPANAVPRWRARYPEVRFKTHRRRWVAFVEADGKTKRWQLVCDLYVTWTGGDNDEDDGTTG